MKDWQAAVRTWEKRNSVPKLSIDQDAKKIAKETEERTGYRSDGYAIFKKKYGEEEALKFANIFDI